MKFGEALPDELPLVFDSWANSFKKSPYAGCVRNKDWEEVSRNTASEIIDRGAVILVGYTHNDAGERRVMGYSVSEPDKNILHWLFVKRDWRGQGNGGDIRRATEQLSPNPAAPWMYTHRTRASARFLGPHYEWNPVPARIKQ